MLVHSLNAATLIRCQRTQICRTTWTKMDFLISEHEHRVMRKSISTADATLCCCTMLLYLCWYIRLPEYDSHFHTILHLGHVRLGLSFPSTKFYEWNQLFASTIAISKIFSSSKIFCVRAILFCCREHNQVTWKLFSYSPAKMFTWIIGATWFLWLNAF